MTKLIIARHGNTFDQHETPARVGGRTDLALVQKGRDQAKALGAHLKAKGLIPGVAYCSTLSRTKDTAKIALKEMGAKIHAYPLDIFDEIDYGPDENKCEADVIARIGKKAIKDWDDHAIVPDGWKISPEEVTQNWLGFAERIINPYDHVNNTDHTISETILVVTSNGIARFAPHLTNNFEGFCQNHPLKLSTGAYGILEYDGNKWRVSAWNERPSL